MPRDRPVQVAIVGEYHIGHIPFLDGLRRAAAERTDVALVWLPIEPSMRPELRLPPRVRSNWSIAASALARRRLASHAGDLDVALLHTQTVALASVGFMHQVPTWISSDATPRNLDESNDSYGNAMSHPVIERAKDAVVRRAYRAARGIVVWNHWAQRSLVRDYGISAERIRVRSPGATVSRTSPAAKPAEPVRILFVGGDFVRKGGPELLQAAAGVPHVELDIVTRDDVPPADGIRVHRGLSPGSPPLRALYERAHIAALPTRGDAHPVALLEALAAGLPVITTAVGAIPEIVADGETGLLVPPRDVAALRTAIETLAGDAGLRTKMGLAAWRAATQDHDQEANAAQVIDWLVETHRGTGPFRDTAS